MGYTITISMTLTTLDADTIAAIATPPGKGGIGIIRVSGPLTKFIAHAITQNTSLKNRYAHYGSFYEGGARETSNQQHLLTPLDEGIAILFTAPKSFTGEDVLELQAHGGPILLDCLLREVVRLGARLARPGEFSERAFLNNKIDLTQAEAIADLINSQSEQAARNALRSLQGQFSHAIQQLVKQVVQLRMYVEAAIDFPEEEIDFITDSKVADDLHTIINQLQSVLTTARQGSILQEGLTVVIAGKPNAGKSSLLNALSGRESAIVSEIAGTTRDVLREQIQIDGMPLHIVDTAGLRDSPDFVEQEGIRRAWMEIEKADLVLLIVDSTLQQDSDIDILWPEFTQRLSTSPAITIIHNKSDLSGMPSGPSLSDPRVIRLSAKNAADIELLREHLKQQAGYTGAGEGGFTARRRHIDALNNAMTALKNGQYQLNEHAAAELLADDLRSCQQALNTITGEFTADDLLGQIFSSFCIGK